MEEMAWGMIVAGCGLFGMLVLWIFRGGFKSISISPDQATPSLDGPHSHESFIGRAT